jgi:hypothetical protein
MKTLKHSLMSNEVMSISDLYAKKVQNLLAKQLQIVTILNIKIIIDTSENGKVAVQCLK